jgi:hypothetical protein
MRSIKMPLPGAFDACAAAWCCGRGGRANRLGIADLIPELADASIHRKGKTMPILFYGALLVIVAGSFQILMEWRRSKISLRRMLLYAGLTLVGAFGLLHVGVGYFTWMYGRDVRPFALAALVADSQSKEFFKADADLRGLKVVDYRPGSAEVLADDAAGHRFSVSLKGSVDDRLDLAAVGPARYGWLGL